MGTTPLEAALLEAWHRLSNHVRHDRVERTRREARLSQAQMSRPWRAWCVAIRASDTRIDKYSALIRPFNDCGEHGVPHSVEMDAQDIAALVKPVLLDWPGVRVPEAAARLGRSPAVVHGWVRKGGVLEVKWCPATPLGYFGRPAPLVWAHEKLDPAGMHGKAPNDILGGMWLSHWQRVPSDAELFAQRVPANRGLGGWSWLCPGLAGNKCGRRADLLYLPVPVWTLGKHLDWDWRTGTRISEQTSKQASEASEDHAAPNEGRPNAQPAPRETQTSPAGAESPDVHANRPRFACRYCHRVINVSMLNGNSGWNKFVGQVSGGLLYGREVARTPEVLEELRITRRRRFAPQKNAVAKRARVIELLKRGWGPRRIARGTGISERCVQSHLQHIYKAEGVRLLGELRRKWGLARPTARQAAVMRLVLQGMTDPQIAARLGIPLPTVAARLYLLYRRIGVRSRKDLRAKYGGTARRDHANRRINPSQTRGHSAARML
ncbi:hypothetical protein PHYC_03769 [Phycisphaerales bacterium]|nr:hypothetical protein PHYC_03769 [Phycisphaerales bacterium]